jgi:hypothetical protein
MHLRAHLYETGMQFATTGMNVSTEKLKSLKIFWQKQFSSSGKLENWQKKTTALIKNLFLNLLKISSKFGQI